MQRNQSHNNRHLRQVLGSAALAAALVAGPGLAGVAFAVEPGPTPTPESTVTASPAPTLDEAKAAPTATQPDAPSPSAPPPVADSGSTPAPDTQSDDARATMAEAVGAGGAEMGQRSARVTANSPTAGPKQLSTEALATEGTWMPTFGIKGLDVSSHQSSVDWRQQWNMGARFAYVKATEGNYYKSPTYSSQYLGSRNAGMIRGAYHFAIPNWSSGADQARYFVQNGGRWSADGYTLPPVLDFEFNPYEGRTINGFYFGNTCYGMSPSQLTSWVRDFGSTVKSLTGRLPVVYTNTSWWRQCLGDPAGFGDYPLWVAAYPNSPTNDAGPVPSSWSTYSFWQFSSSGPFAGDSNIWNGTMAQLQKFASEGTVTRPSIMSTGDVVAADANGILWDYPATGTGGFGPRKQIGQGWTGLRSINAIDWNADGVLDLVAQWTSGRVNVYLGVGAGGFSTGPVLAASGWGDFQLTVGYWLSSSRFPQIITRDDAGGLRLWRNTAGSGLSTGTTIGQGWSGLNLTMIDFDGDGHQDILAQDVAGAMRLYRSDGGGSFLAESRKTVGSGWNQMTSVTVTANFKGVGTGGLMARSSDGRLIYYPVPGNTSWGPATAIGSGWNTFLIAGGETVNYTPPSPSITSASDVVTIDAAGGLFRHSTGGGSLGAATKIGAGFTGMASVHVTDWNADGFQDLASLSTAGALSIRLGLSAGGFAAPSVLASGLSGADITFGYWLRASKYPGLVVRRSDGALQFHANTSGGTLGPTADLGPGFARAHVSMTDADGDGNQDIIAVDYLGRMTLFRSNGTGTFIAESRKVIGNGWNVMNSISPIKGFAGPASNGVLARDSGGTLTYYPLHQGVFGPKSVLTPGWSNMLFSGSAYLTAERPINSTADVLSVDATGTLWNHPAGAGETSGAYPIGTGWLGMKSLNVVDWNSDGIPDVLAQKTTGSLSAYLGAESGGFSGPVTAATAGFSQNTIIAGDWVTGSKYPGLVGYGSDGMLNFWANPGRAALSGPVRIGTGWGGLKLAMVDFDTDGHQDLLAVASSGSMKLYRSTGTGSFVPESRKIVGSGWQSFRQFSGTAGFADAASKGVLALQTSGQLRYYPIVAGSNWGAVSTAGTVGSASLVSFSSATR